MKIIIINYRYFISGGPERYLFNVKLLLEKNGHTVIPFSIKSKFNKPSEYDKYFLDPIGDGKEIYFKEYDKTNFKTVLTSFSRMFYSLEAKKKLDLLIKDTKPDLIYVLHYQNKISVSIFDAALENKIPVVHRISDFGQICANGLFFRPNQKDICERCLNGSKINAVINKCVQNSYTYSSLKAASVQLQKTKGIFKKVQAFVVPSNFTISKLRAYGFPEQKLIRLPTFFSYPKNADANADIHYKPFALYIGRIEPEKGLLTLVKSFENTEFNLKIIGFSNTGFEEELKNYLTDKKHNIEFLGRMEFDEIQTYLSQCLFTVVPSEWYDNFPNSILESFAYKKCVIATNIGSLPELVIHNKTGLLFNLKDSQQLKKQINTLFQNKELCIQLGMGAFEKLQNEFSEDQHYRILNDLFNNIINNRNLAIA